MKSPRLAALSGVAFVVLIVVAFTALAGETPEIDDSASKITSYYDDHQGREIVAGIVVMLGALFLAIFASSLREFVRGTGDGGDLWPNVVLIGGAVAVAGFMVAVGIHFALIDGADKDLGPDAMVALNALDNDDFFAFAFPLGVMLLGAAGAILRDGAALPKWMAWVAIVLLIVFFTPAGFAAFGLSGIWIIVASILMYQRSAPAAAPTA
jgi:hypothetical protein